jgi:hypothetical protein
MGYTSFLITSGGFDRPVVPCGVSALDKFLLRPGALVWHKANEFAGLCAGAKTQSADAIASTTKALVEMVDQAGTAAASGAIILHNTGLRAHSFGECVVRTGTTILSHWRIGVGLSCLGLVCVAYNRLHPRISDEEVWNYVAASEDDLGDPNVAQPLRPEVRAVGDDRELNDFDSKFSTWHWRQQLITLLKTINILPELTTKWDAMIDKKRARRRAGLQMLYFRNLIFQVRNDVFTKVSREAVRDHTEINRLVIARHVEESMNSINVGTPLRAKIREACVNSCFVNTMYDDAGMELALGPQRRPV